MQIKILERKNLYKGYLAIDAFKLQFELFEGGMSPVVSREVCLRGEAVAIVPYDPVLDQVLLIEQFRLPAHCRGIDAWLLEIPAGLVEEGEEKTEVAQREMIEETGLTVRDLKFLHNYLPSPGALTEMAHLYVGKVDLSPLSKGHKKIHGLKEEGEDIRLCPTPVSEIPNLLAAGRVCNATALLGLYWLLHNHTILRKEWTP